MGPEHRKIARHALGLDNPDAKGRSYRNRFYASKGHAAWHDLHDMCREGWMNLEDVGSQTLFTLTRAGAMLALDAGETLDTEDFPA